MAKTTEADKPAAADRERGVWVAYYPDGSGLSIHRSELAAFRAANGTTMVVVFWPFDKSWADVITATIPMLAEVA